MSIGIPNTHTLTHIPGICKVYIQYQFIVIMFLQSFITIFVCIGGRERDFLEPGFRSPSLEGQGMMTKIS